MKDRDKVLLIDDDSKNIFALCAVLRSRGLDCVTAGSAKEGIAKMKEHPDLAAVLLDMMMPDTDGYAALAIIKNDEAINKVPVIAVTAQVMPGDRERCLAAGADGYISKPVDIDLLLEVLTDLRK